MMDDDEYYVFLSSDDSRGVYATNRPDSFTVQLAEPIVLGSGVWYCTLESFSAKWNKLATDLCVYCSAIEDSYVNDTRQPILQRVYTANRRVVREFVNPPHMRVKTQVLHSIAIYIKSTHRDNLALTDEPTRCTLRFFRK